VFGKEGSTADKEAVKGLKADIKSRPREQDPQLQKMPDTRTGYFTRKGEFPAIEHPKPTKAQGGWGKMGGKSIIIKSRPNRP
jgi:hypothetical protein